MDRWAELKAFICVAESAGFAPAATVLGVAPSNVSRQIASLEDRLGVRLFTRTTRRVNLTDEGERFLDTARRLLSDLEEAEANIAGRGALPRGKLRVSCVVTLAERWMPGLMTSFLARYPDMSVELIGTESYVDPVRDGFDVAIVAGPLPDSSHVRRQLGTFTRIVVAVPDYLERHGRPETPSDLAHHQCLVFSGMPQLQNWPFVNPAGARSERAVRGSFAASSAETILGAALAGAGIARLADFMVSPLLKSGALEEVLAPYRSPDLVPLSAIYPETLRASPKVKAFISHLAENFAPTAPWETEKAAS